MSSLFSSLSFLSLSLLSTVEARRGLLHRESDHHRVNGCLLTPRRTKADKEKGPGARENNDDIPSCVHWKIMSFFRHTIDASRVWLFIYIAKRFWLREPPSKGKETRFRRRRPGKRLASSFVSFDDRETLCERTHTRQNRYRA